MPGEPVSSANGKVFIGNAVQVDGARPDVDATCAAPFDYQAGWGYLLLTNMLPNQGNGTFTLYAYATDVEGHTMLLGSRTITLRQRARDEAVRHDRHAGAGRRSCREPAT